MGKNTPPTRDNNPADPESAWAKRYHKERDRALRQDERRNIRHINRTRKQTRRLLRQNARLRQWLARADLPRGERWKQYWRDIRDARKHRIATRKQRRIARLNRHREHYQTVAEHIRQQFNLKYQGQIMTVEEIRYHIRHRHAWRITAGQESVALNQRIYAVLAALAESGGQVLLTHPERVFNRPGLHFERYPAIPDTFLSNEVGGYRYVYHQKSVRGNRLRLFFQVVHGYTLRPEYRNNAVWVHFNTQGEIAYISFPIGLIDWLQEYLNWDIYGGYRKQRWPIFANHTVAWTGVRTLNPRKHRPRRFYRQEILQDQVTRIQTATARTEARYTEHLERKADHYQARHFPHHERRTLLRMVGRDAAEQRDTQTTADAGSEPSET